MTIGKNVNEILDYSKILVDSLGKRTTKEIKQIEYLVFAGMMAYYGDEHAREVYEAFKNIDFVTAGKDITKSFGSLLIVTPVKEKIKGTNPVAYYAHLYGGNGDNPVGRVYVSSDSKFNFADKVEGVTQEVNRVVNAINKTYVKHCGSKLLRTGLSNRQLFSAQSDLSIFEDSVNALQTGEIMNCILEFANHDINDPELASAVSMISYFRDRECSGLGYEFTKALIRPLYEDDNFNEVLKESRLSGEVRRVEDEFDSRAGHGSFEELVQACEYIEYGSCPDYVLDVNGDKINTLIKEYKSHK